MKIRPPPDHENQPSPDTADLREKPSPGFLLIPLSDQHGRQTIHTDVLQCDIFEEQEILSRGSDMSEGNSVYV
jgi:hypothetical protein